MIGFFDLDPNRVVALVLEGYAAQPGAAAFQRLLELFTREAVTQTLGFTLQQQAGPEAGETAEGLLLVVAHLVKVPLRIGFRAARTGGQGRRFVYTVRFKLEWSRVWKPGRLLSLVSSVPLSSPAA